MNKDELLQGFITEFLPPQNNKRKYSTNEIRSIQNSLNKVLFKFFGFRISIVDLIQILDDSGYKPFEKVLEQGKEMSTKDLVDGTMYTAPGGGYLHYNVSPVRLRLLSQTSAKLPPNANLEKVKEVEKIKEQVQKWVTINKVNSITMST